MPGGAVTTVVREGGAEEGDREFLAPQRFIRRRAMTAFSSEMELGKFLHPADLGSVAVEGRGSL